MSREIPPKITATRATKAHRLPVGVYPHGLDLQAVVSGMLQQWHRTTTGYWAGWATYKLGGDYGGQRAAHWVGAYALDPRREGMTR